MTGHVALHALPGVPEVAIGADLGAVVVEALQRASITLASDDALVVAQKIVSKAEGRLVRLADVRPSARAAAIAAQCLKDPRLVELVLAESSELVRVAPHVLIARHRLGYVLANAGIDRSNTGAAADSAVVLLLPEDPDASAARLRAAVAARTGVAPAVIVSDSFGRPWRIGTVNVALGVAGLAAVVDLRGRPDRDGRTLEVSQVALADAVAAGAGLVMGEATEGCPLVLVRGLAPALPHRDGQALLRPLAEDLFR